VSKPRGDRTSIPHTGAGRTRRAAPVWGRCCSRPSSSSSAQAP
jgi:hypothetical protein